MAVRSQKLQKVLAQSGLGSRRAMEELIASGKVRVNSTPATLGQRVTTEDLIQVGRRQIKFQVTTRLPRVILYHKPEGEIVSRDDESTPAVGVSRANELIGERVAVIIEGWNSPVTLAMQPVIARAGVLDLTAISKADPILSGEGNPLAVRFNSSNSQDGAVIANYIANVAKAKRIAFLTENDAYGNLEQMVAMKRAIPNAEIMIVNNAEHVVQATHPHFVGPAILEFLGRQQPSPRP